jgi:hypothetical protein
VRFQRHIGIDYSGAETPTSRQKGIQVYEVRDGKPPAVVTPPSIQPERPRNWCRQELAHWLVEQLCHGETCLVGIDHCFSFPVSYMARNTLTTWDAFLAHVASHWPTDQQHWYVDFVRDEGRAPTGDSTELRMCERWTSSAKSVFLWDVHGSVAKSSHAGIPWLKYIRERCAGRLHVWPFDGWEIPDGRSVIVEVYPSIFSRRFPRENRTGHQQDAYAVARWLCEADERRILDRYLSPPLTDAERAVAQLEGWILGIA